MAKIRIKLPTGLSDISLLKGIQIMETLEVKEDIKDLSLSEKISILSLITDLPVSLFMDFDPLESQVNLLFNKLELFKDQFRLFIPETFRIDKTYGLMDFNKMTVREYMDIDFWIHEGDSPFSNLHKIMAIVYRPVKTKKRNPKNVLKNIASRLLYKGVVPKFYSSYTIEDLSEEHELNAEEFLNKSDFSFGYGVLLQIQKYNKDLKERYPLLFRTEEQEEEAQTLEDDIEFGSLWGMYHILMSISSSIFERDAWLNRPIGELYKYLSYLKQKDIYGQKRGS